MNGLLIAALPGTDVAALRKGVTRTGTRVEPAADLAGPPPDGAPPVVFVGVAPSSAPGVRPHEVVLATHAGADPSDGPVLRFAAAPLLAAGLRDAGLTVALSPVAADTLGLDGGTAALAGPADVDRPCAAVLVTADPAGPVLTRLVAALEDWAAAAGPRTVLLAQPRSFCAGVDRAIMTVERLLELSRGPVYVRRQIVHNAHVVTALEQRGAVFVRELDEVPDGATVVLSAHGVSPAVREEAGTRDLDVVDATCPLVAKVHAEARHAAGRGDTVVLIGHAGHEEVEGTLGEAPESTILITTPDDVATLDLADPAAVTYVTQTTLAVAETAAVVDALRARYPDARGPASDDICYATSNRQAAVLEVATRSDVVLVIGSANSSNSLRLVEVAAEAGARAYLVDDAGEVRPSWLIGARTVGLTAGASAPPYLVDELRLALEGLGRVTCESLGIGTENVTFDLPKEVRT
jgi:4-hydroxy-3-methylbut-2-enyl diphosphate reductase